MTDEPEVKQGIKVRAAAWSKAHKNPLLVGVAAVLIWYFGYYQYWSVRPWTCIEGANERCPTPDWMTSYNEFQRGQSHVKFKMWLFGITDDQRTLAGWAQDLGKGIPTQEGYSFDEKLKKFTKPVLPPNPPAPPQPVKP